MTMFRRIVLTALLAAGLAACSGDKTDDAVAVSEAIAAIPAPNGGNWLDVAAVTPEGGHQIGNPDAPVKLVEYASHTCPHCAEFDAEAGETIKNKYVASGVVSYELRNQIHDAIDLTIARLARCGNDPSAYIPLSEQVWQNLAQIVAPVQQNPALMENAMKLPENQRFPALAQQLGLVDFFAARGIAANQQLQCLSDFASLTEIADRSEKQSDELNVTGTPTFFINGRNLGTLRWAELEANLQNAGAR
ncbi:thioredoxin domain-containing protein [Altererythrobacter salegens]|uniref:Thioredoxin domain-containing protein n=1 Tax=Croceibacterium salegens TaxID=1737568 RepID=A0A6I4SU08_9SPHN|nr:thioredoxin domain-containing protein [Croceibacterium salegens]MXO58366.1 thioredoxin domain-containing protein [Croceibacterium salegens]